MIIYLNKQKIVAQISVYKRRPITPVVFVIMPVIFEAMKNVVVTTYSIFDLHLVEFKQVTLIVNYKEP